MRAATEPGAVDSNLEWLHKESARNWDRDLAKNPILTKLLLADALLARYDVALDQSSIYLDEQRSWLKGRVGELIADCNDKATLQDFTVRRLVLKLFPNGGLKRLDARLSAIPT